MATSTKQTLATIQVYDYELDPAGNPLVGKRVRVTLAYDQAQSIAPNPTVNVDQSPVYSAITDSNGFWQVAVVPNNRLTPANTVYTVSVEGSRTYQISVSDVGVPAAGWQSSAILVSAPASLTPAGQTVGPLTVTGLLTAQAGLSVTGLTTGQIVFPTAGGLLSGDAGLFWDNTNKRLGIGTNAPGDPLTVAGSSVFPFQLNSSGTDTIQRFFASSNQNWWLRAAGTGSGLTPSHFFIYDGTNSSSRFEIDNFVGGGELRIGVGGHLISQGGGSPTLGALQTGISSQSMASGTDTRFLVNVTTSGTPPVAASAVVVINWASSYGAAPIVTPGQTALITFVTFGESTAGVTFKIQQNAAASTTYSIPAEVIG